MPKSFLFGSEQYFFARGGELVARLVQARNNSAAARHRTAAKFFVVSLASAALFGSQFLSRCQRRNKKKQGDQNSSSHFHNPPDSCRFNLTVGKRSRWEISLCGELPQNFLACRRKSGRVRGQTLNNATAARRHISTDSADIASTC